MVIINTYSKYRHQYDKTLIHWSLVEQLFNSTLDINYSPRASPRGIVLALLQLITYRQECLYYDKTITLDIHVKWGSKQRYVFLGHLSHSDDLLLWVGVHRRLSFVVCKHLLLKNYLANLNEILQVSSIYLFYKNHRRQEIVNFMTHHYMER